MSKTMYRCVACGKEMDGRGRKGHVRYSSGDEHGDEGRLPDDWESVVPPVDGEEDDDDGDTEEATDEDVSEAVEDADDADDDGDTDETPGRLHRALWTDVRALWGGDE
jgi:hypothetical protein